MNRHARIYLHVPVPRPSLSYRIAEALTLPALIFVVLAIGFLASWRP